MAKNEKFPEVETEYFKYCKTLSFVPFKEIRGETMEHNLHKIDNLSMGKPEPYMAEAVDEVIVRFSNAGYSPKPTPEMRLSTEKSNCKGDYGCCGALP